MANTTQEVKTSSLSNWDFHNKKVQQELVGGQFISAESTLVCSGAPELAQTTGGGDIVYPIGILESFAIQQNKQLQRIFEIGSSRSYFIPGRTVGSISIGRTLYFGPSLLRVLYAYYRSDKGENKIGVTAAEATLPTTHGYNSLPNPDNALLNVFTDLTVLPEIRRSPGTGYFFIDLASDLFAQPHGMCLFFKDQQNLTLGGLYLENCYVQGHQLNVSSGSVLIMEGASVQYDQIKGIKTITD